MLAAGKRITKEERAAWHKDVRVRFQPKAWYDEEMCEQYALEEVKEITAESRKAGRESVAIFDNLSGQTTPLHLKNLAKNKCKRHLLPAGMTDELQLVDDGVGFALKNEMGRLHDNWLMEEGNLEMWTAGGKEFPMWQKRVLITQLAAPAWENICGRFDFEKAATRLGMRMTINGSGDQHIRIQGVETYSFCDADGGAAGAESDEEGVDPEEEEEENADVALTDSSDDEAGVAAGAADSSNEEEGAAAGAAADGEEDEYEGNFDSSDEEDDTAGGVADTIGGAVAPAGYELVEGCPPLDTEMDKNEMIGKTILHGWDSKAATGWFIGTVQSRNLSATDLKKTPTANFVIKYNSKTSDGALNGNVACELSARTHGPLEWWVVVKKGAEPLASSADGKGKGKGKGQGKKRAQ